MSTDSFPPGGYDAGYAHCSCFWGTEPGSLIQWATHWGFQFNGKSVIDIGCGEGKNAVYCARRGAQVLALDVSETALSNAKQAWRDYEKVKWLRADARELILEPDSYDLVILYGVLHCLPSEADISSVIAVAHQCTKPMGLNILCAFNNRHQELEAHPGFNPTLLSHSVFTNLYDDWDILLESDQDLHETHPHNKIPHTHSMTRIVAQKK